MQQVRRTNRGHDRACAPSADLARPAGQVWPIRRRRRLTAFAGVLLAVGALSLAGCRSDPVVAAYVGDARYSQSRVSDIADDAFTKLRDAVTAQSGGASEQPVERPVTERDVVTALVSRDVLKAEAEEKHITPASIDPNQVAQAVGVPPEAEYVRLLVEEDSYRQALMEQAPAATPSEEDLREVYDNLVKASNGTYTNSFEQFKATLVQQDAQLVGRAGSLRKELAGKAHDLDVAVNPRYAPAFLSLVDINDQAGGLHSLLGVPFDERDNGVRDLT